MLNYLENRTNCVARPGHCAAFQITSADCGHTWTTPRSLAPALQQHNDGVRPGPGRGIQLTSVGPKAGRILMSGSFSQRFPGTIPAIDVVWYSDDHGQSYTLSPARLPLGDESTLVQLANGSVVINMRNQAASACSCRLVAISHDAGETFSAPYHIPDLIEPGGCQGSLLRLVDGPHLFFSNPASKAGRVNMTIKRSSDGGATWPDAVVVYQGASAYSCLAELSSETPGRVGLAFEHGTANSTDYGSISFTAVPASAWRRGSDASGTSAPPPPLGISINTTAAAFETSDRFLSFAVDREWLDAQPNPPLPADELVPLDLTSELLRAMLSSIAPGYLRFGGTYTDYVLYMVPDSSTGKQPWDPTCGVPTLGNGTIEQSTCPPNSYPCCLHLSTARWNETLHFAHDVGAHVVFNLNLLHGRGFPPRYGKGPCVVKAAWDSANAEALLRWTVANVPPAMWPSHFGLGNELDDCLTADQWLADLCTLQAVIDRVFPAAGGRPRLVAPDVAQGTLDWQRDFLEGWASAPALANASDGAAFAYHSCEDTGTVAPNPLRCPPA